MESFTETLLAEMKDIPDLLHIIISRLRHEKTVGIWGTGVAGQMVLSMARKQRINIDFFVDGTMKNDYGSNVMNTSVISPRIIPPDAFIVIAADVNYGIHKLLQNHNNNPYCYIDPLLFAHYTADMKDKVMDEILSSRSEIDSMYAKFNDEKSKKTFRNVLIHRAVHHIELLWEVFEQNQYFRNDVIQSASGCFIDCGAYTGDTLRAFLAQVSDNNYQYYAFEPEQDNYAALKEFVEGRHLRNVQLFPIGLWGEKTYLHFLENGADDSLAWKLDASPEVAGLSVPVDSLDNVLQNVKADYIKMDIEGSELKAMLGGRSTIRKWKPQLAISAYHELNHLWKVPQTILDMNPSYTLFFRHHSWNMADTVCYGI